LWLAVWGVVMRRVKVFWRLLRSRFFSAAFITLIVFSVDAICCGSRIWFLCQNTILHRRFLPKYSPAATQSNHKYWIFALTRGFWRSSSSLLLWWVAIWSDLREVSLVDKVFFYPERIYYDKGV
jgi:hypothetical protein